MTDLEQAIREFKDVYHMLPNTREIADKLRKGPKGVLKRLNAALAEGSVTRRRDPFSASHAYLWDISEKEN